MGLLAERHLSGPKQAPVPAGPLHPSGPKQAPLHAPRWHRTGLLEKHDPLPVGRYWLDVYDTQAWDQWLNSHGKPLVDADLGINIPATVKLLKTSHYPADESNGYPPGDWVLFDVMAPTPWGYAKQLGWPNIADASIQGPEDTVQRPPPEQDILDKLNEGKLGWVPWAVGGVVGVVGIVALAKLIRG